MKKCFWLWLLMLPLLPLQADDFERAQRVLVQVRQGQGDSLVAQFHPAIREALPAEAVSQLWKQLEQERGALLRQGPWRAERRDTLLLEQCHLYFEKDSLTFSLLTDSCRYIVGFHFTPLLVPVEYAPEKVQAEVDYEERDTLVVNDRYRLPATICQPVRQRDSLWPVLVFVHDVGPVDRDGTLGPNKPFRETARRLAASGIASLRYDKRSFVYGARTNEWNGVTTYDTEVVDDALRALECAARLPGVDSLRVYVAGHSLGGMLAPRIAMLSRVPVAGLIALAGAARPLQELLQAQMRYMATVQGGTMAEADSLSNFLYTRMSEPYRAFAAAYNPVGTARGLRMPMLFLQGGHDYQVTRADFQLWQRGLEGREGVRFVWLEECDHLFRETPRMAVPEDYMQPGNVSDRVLRAIISFVGL